MGNKKKSTKRDPKDVQWAEAKRVCRLSRRQIDMAKALGMNPKKLPGLRPSPSQQWKAPVGEFIEECYFKRFKDKPIGVEGDGSLAAHPRRQDAPPAPRPERDPVSEAAWRAERDTLGRAESLTCYLINLYDGLTATLVAKEITPELLVRIAGELRRVAEQLTTGESVLEMPEIEGLSDTQGDDVPRSDYPDQDIPF